MTETKHTEIEERIQRLVDGDLDEEQRIALLQWIDAEAPEAWRTVALGYVEAEVLRSLFREEEEGGWFRNRIPFPEKQASRTRLTTALVAAVTLILGVLLGAGLQPGSIPTEAEIAPVAGANPIETPEPIPPSLQAIQSLDLALRERGFEPVVTTAVFQADLPDGRRLSLPLQRLTFQP